MSENLSTLTLNHFFDKIYCINLDRRQDRWEKCVKLFEKHNLKVQRVQAIDWKDIKTLSPELDDRYKANVANLMSVIKVFRMSGNRTLLLEDDVDFIDNLNEQFVKNVDYLPRDWGYLYLGGNHEGGYQPIKFDDGELAPFFKCNKTYALHAFGYTFAAGAVTWRYLTEQLSKIFARPNEKLRDVVCADYWIGELQSQIPENYRIGELQTHIPTYSFLKPLAWQRSDYSDIEQKDSNYEWLLKYNFE